MSGWGGPFEVPLERDAIIRASIEAHFQPTEQIVRRPFPLRHGWIAAGSAAAAVIVLAIGLLPFVRGRGEPAAPPTLTAALREAESIAADKGPFGAATDPRVTAILLAVVSMPAAVDAPSLPASGRFVVFDVVVDALDLPLAAWQAELRLPGAIAGIEGGEGPFASPATYDPVALASGQVVLAGIADPLPFGSTTAGQSIRVASVTIWLGRDGPTPAVGAATLLAPASQPLAGSLRLQPRNP